MEERIGVIQSRRELDIQANTLVTIQKDDLSYIYMYIYEMLSQLDLLKYYIYLLNSIQYY